MSFSGLGGGWVEMPLPVAGQYDYLSGGVGLAELQRLATEVVDLLISGKAGAVRGLIPYGSASAYQWTDANRTYVPANPLIAAIWNGQIASARLLAALVVNTLVREQATKAPKDRKSAQSLAWDVVPRLTSTLLNGGDPAGCLMTLQDGMNAWSGVANVVEVTQTSVQNGSSRTLSYWCDREFILSSSTPCQPDAICKWKVDGSGVPRPVVVPKPAADAILAPKTAASNAPQPPPTHAQVDAIVTQKMADEGQSLEHMESVQELQELAIYLGALAQARQWLTLGLHIPAGATDAQVWAALKARDIDPAEALDWFFGCDAGADCFRERMNRALGEAEERARSKRTKLMVGVGAAGAALVAILALRSRGGR